MFGFRYKFPRGNKSPRIPSVSWSGCSDENESKMETDARTQQLKEPRRNRFRPFHSFLPGRGDLNHGKVVKDEPIPPAGELRGSHISLNFSSRVLGPTKPLQSSQAIAFLLWFPRLFPVCIPVAQDNGDAAAIQAANSTQSRNTAVS